jgi:hypothetical protein
MISFVEPFAAGNAVRLHLSPPAGAAEWRVLRRPTDAFQGPEDPGAVRAGDPGDPWPGAVTDAAGLMNGVAYLYKFYWKRAADGAWLDEPAVPFTPQATYGEDAPDALVLVRDRIAAGLAVEVKRGTLKPASGRIQVVTALFPLPEATKLPCVSVHLDTDESGARFLGENLAAEFPSGIGSELVPDEGDGWFSNVGINIVGVSLNGDERSAMRRAIKRVVQANLALFEDLGLSQISLRQQDSEEPGENNAVLYLTAARFTCVAPSRVAWKLGRITGVSVTVITSDGEQHDG